MQRRRLHPGQPRLRDRDVQRHREIARCAVPRPRWWRRRGRRRPRYKAPALRIAQAAVRSGWSAAAWSGCSHMPSTVRSESTSWPAMARLVRPAETSAAISRSRRVSGGGLVACSRSRARRSARGRAGHIQAPRLGAACRARASACPKSPGSTRSQGGGPVQPGQTTNGLAPIWELMVTAWAKWPSACSVWPSSAASWPSWRCSEPPGTPPEPRYRPGGERAQQVVGGLCRLPVTKGNDQDDHRPERAQRVEVRVPGGGQVAEGLVYLACLLGPAGGERRHGAKRG